jgi:hypothetical protein
MWMSGNVAVQNLAPAMLDDEEAIQQLERQNIRPSRPNTPQNDPKDPIDATQHWSSTFPLQHSNLLAQREHLQRDIQAATKENPEGGENRPNFIDHKSAVARCNDSASRISFVEQTIGLTHQ